MVRSLLVLASLAVPALAQGKVDFQRQIWPILEKRCVECHATEKVAADGTRTKPKGGVVLDSKEGITKSKRGRLAVAQRPDDSLLYQSTTLPADDEDRMPPAKKGDPLSKAQTDLIQAWIQQGADFGSWTGNSKEAPAVLPAGTPSAAKGGTKPAGTKTPTKPTTAEILAALQKGLAPVRAEVLAQFATGPFQVASIGDDSPLLRVTTAGQTDLVDDKALLALLPIATNITELDLGRCHIGDEGAPTLAKMPRLTVLDLRQTQIGNHGVAALVACKELRTLNLFGTKVGDYGATALASLKGLEELYLWQTEVTAAAVVRLRESIPGVKVVMAAELPEPMEGAPAGGKKRAGK